MGLLWALLDSFMLTSHTTGFCHYLQMVVMCMRRKTASYIRKYASAAQRGGLTLQEELLLAEGYTSRT